MPPAAALTHGNGPDNQLTPVEVDSKDSPWFCDACDLALESQQALKSHRRSHVKCTECSFEGVPKIVKAHYQGTHGKFSGSGFKTVTIAVPGCRVQRFRICVGNRPEDIQRWIEDRKKRFPRQHVAKNETKENKDDVVRVEKETETQGMTSLLAGYGSSGSESGDEEEINSEKKIAASDNASTPVPQQAEKTASISTQVESVPRGNRPCRYFMRNGSCLNGDACRFSHETSPQPFATSTGAKKRKRGGHTTSDTLLRKLLASDMEREASLTMQLLQFIVDKDFFD